jgi:hypothetical protein
MRFEVFYATGTRHEVELPGSVVVIGRDPGCDLVLNDARCSRRHAVVEEGPGGLVIRDAGSANGIEVNGRKVERAPLRSGDTVRLGDVRLKVLAGVDATVVVGPEGLDFATGVAVGGPVVEPPFVEPAAAEPPGAEPPAAASVAVTLPTSERATALNAAAARPRLARRGSRPLTVTVLVVLWLATALAAPTAGLLVAVRGDLGRIEAAGLVAVAFLVGAASVVMAAGLRALAPWARHLQIAIAALGLFACPFSLASVTVLLYLLRPEVKQGFEERDPNQRSAGAGPAEATFALSLLGMLALGLLATAVLARYLGVLG